jgi:hypothetical protein
MISAPASIMAGVISAAGASGDLVMAGMTENEEQVCFYFELGLAITQWAHVEQAMSWLVSHCLASKEETAVARSFFSIENFRSKLAFTDAVIQETQSIKAATKAEWNGIRPEVETASGTRNKLAHYSVIHLLHAKPGRRMAFYPRIAKPDNKKPKSRRSSHVPRGSLYVTDLHQARLQFSRAMCKLENLLCEMRGDPPRFAADALQVRKAPQPAQLARQMRSMLPPREKPSRE